MYIYTLINIKKSCKKNMAKKYGKKLWNCKKMDSINFCHIFFAGFLLFKNINLLH